MKSLLRALGFIATPPANPAQSNIVADVLGAAEWMAMALSSSGYLADFSLASLRDVDRFFAENAPDGRAHPDGLLAEDLVRRIFGLGAYVGEVIRRRCGGTWEGNDADPKAAFNVALRLDHGHLIWPTQRAAKRFQNGPEDSVYFYGYMILRDHRQQGTFRHVWAAIDKLRGRGELRPG